MNPLTNTRNIKALNENDIKNGIFDHRRTWHSQYKDCAYIFVGGLPFELSEGDVICVFSQYGEIVNINLVRDKKTGKSQGYCFICYEDQRSTILAVDNLNSIKLGGRTIRVDHVSNYRPPRSDEKDEEGNYKIKDEKGCAPKTPSPEPDDEVVKKSKAHKKEKKKRKKDQKEKKKKKKKDVKDESSSESTDNEDDRKITQHKIDHKQDAKKKPESQWDKDGKDKKPESQWDKDGKNNEDRDSSQSKRNRDRSPPRKIRKSHGKTESNSDSTDNEEDNKITQHLSKVDYKQDMKKKPESQWDNDGKSSRPSLNDFSQSKSGRDRSPPRKIKKSRGNNESNSDSTDNEQDRKINLSLGKMVYKKNIKKKVDSQSEKNVDSKSSLNKDRDVSPSRRRNRSRSRSRDSSPPRKRNRSRSRSKDFQ